MNIDEISQFIGMHGALLFWLGIGTFVGLVALVQNFRVYAWYLIVLLAALVGSILIQDLLYFYAFVLGMLTAFAEILGKFSDEPIKSLGTPHAVFYHLLNGLIAAFALKVLVLYNVPSSEPIDQLKVVTIAGVGSMLAMRSKLFNIKVAGEDVSFGPEQIIKVFLNFMQSAIDRVRAQSRVDFVKSKLDNINFDAVYDYSLTMLEAAQALADKDKKELLEGIPKLKSGEPTDKQLKSYRLGFLLLNKMGEDFGYCESNTFPCFR